MQIPSLTQHRLLLALASRWSPNEDDEKASFNISGYSPANQVIIQAMKIYGFILADNGHNLYISRAPDSR
jgi:hypothetical protein